MSDALRPTVPAAGDTLLAPASAAVEAAPVIGAELPAGTMLKDTYRVVRKLGEGGMGSVYLAEHSAIGKKVAIKVLGPAFLHQPEIGERFLREARAAAMIESDHVIEIHDFGTTPAGAAFFVMEYLQGEDLAQLIQREGSQPWSRARPLLLQICSGLHAAHERGVIHRDMKPDNCYLLARAGGEAIKVIDFGIAKFASAEHDGSKPLTHAGMIFGTPEYMAPEQARGAPQDRRVDVYATGVIMFELLTGQRPFAADSFMGLLHKQMVEAPPRPSAVRPDARIPAEVDAIILKALQKDPELRFQTMRELAAAIEAVGTGAAAVTVMSSSSGLALGFRGEPAPRRRGWRTFALVAGLAAAATGLALMLTEDAPAPAAPALAGPLPVGAPPPATHPELLAPTPTPLTSTPPGPDLLPLEPAPKVRLQIHTGAVAADVLDARGQRLGGTADPAGIALPRSSTPVELVLHADGYDDLTLKLVPDHDLELEQALRRRPTRPGKKSPAKAIPAPPVPEPPKPPKPAGSPDLIPLGG